MYELTLAGVFFLFPQLLLLVKGSMSGSLMLLFVCSLFWIALRLRGNTGFSAIVDRPSVLFCVAMACPWLVVAISEIAHGRWLWANFDGPSRFLLVVPVFITLRKVDLRCFRGLEFGLPLGGIVAGLIALIAPIDWGYGRVGSSFVNPIHFGNLALALGILSIFSINWGRVDPFHVRIIKLVGFGSAVFASIESGSRGGWIALPPLLATWIWFSGSEGRRKELFLMIAILTLVVFFGYDEINHRISALRKDLLELQVGTSDSSLGIRLQHWQVGVRMFIDNPLFGAGLGSFNHHAEHFVNQGLLTPLAAAYGAGEMHNELLSKLAQTGLIGAIGNFAIYLIPFLIFISRLNDYDLYRQRSAQMGVSVVISFFIFGLTVEIFSLKMTTSFYALIVTIFLAAALPRGKPNVQRTDSDVE
jgi:O-antigen ligase